MKTKAFIFLKESLFFSLILGSLLYVLMRVFFIGAAFSTIESIELYLKTCFVTWAYINAWRLICLGIVWLEKKYTTVKVTPVVSMSMLKKTAIFILIVSLSGAVKARSSYRIEEKPVQVTSTIDYGEPDINPKFYFLMKY